MGVLAAGSSTTLTFQLHPSSKTTTQFLPKKTHSPKFRRKTLISCMSLNIPKEDKPISTEILPETTSSPATELTPPYEEDDDGLSEQERERLKLRMEEKFVVLNTGVYGCMSCGYRYNEKLGDPSYPIPPGLEFRKLPEDWRCPTCGAAKSFFESKRVEIAGFAQNQQYGFGGNTLTSGQKGILIYGSLLLAFILFLSGYFIQ